MRACKCAVIHHSSFITRHLQASVVNRKFVAEIRIVMPVKTGIQAIENALDSGLRRNDGIVLRISDSGH
jgi:hypothetical protein